MTKTYINLEWIGVATPTNDDTIGFNKMAGRYSKLEEQTLEAVSALLRPRVRQVGSTRRTMRSDAAGGVLGLNHSYRFGERSGTFIQRVEEHDAMIILACPDEYEFRNLDDPAHDSRVPIVPPQFMTKTISEIIANAKHDAPPVAVGGPAIYDNAQGVLRRYEELREQRAERR